MNKATYHEVNGIVIEVVPVVDDILQASAMEAGHVVCLSLDSTGNYDFPTVASGVATGSQELAVAYVPSTQLCQSMAEAIRQRRSGEVNPEDLPPAWLDL